MLDLNAAALGALCYRIPELACCRESIEAAFERISACYRAGGKLLCCGNGGSASDCEHIAGELMKGFLKRRPLDTTRRSALACQGLEGERLAERLQGALPCVSLTGAPALTTAFANDVDPELVFAQQIMGLGKQEDVLLAISTSGSAKNCACAVLAAKAVGMGAIALTGRGGGRLAELSDVAIRVPADETYRVQEYHLPVYHTLCAMLETAFFDE